VVGGGGVGGGGGGGGSTFHGEQLGEVERGRGAGHIGKQKTEEGAVAHFQISTLSAFSLSLLLS